MQHLAGIFVVLSVLASLVLGDVVKALLPVLLGASCGWSYLRFFQVKGESELKCAARLFARLPPACLPACLPASYPATACLISEGTLMTG